MMRWTRWTDDEAGSTGRAGLTLVQTELEGREDERTSQWMARSPDVVARTVLQSALNRTPLLRWLDAEQ
jgi:hypothetical protein